MRSAIPVFLEDQDVAYIDRLAKDMARKRNTGPSRSEAVAWLVKYHRKKMLAKGHVDFVA